MSNRVPPSVVPLNAVPPTPAAEAVTGVRIARLITQKRSGSNLTQGCSWLDPGEVSKAWTSTEERGPNSGDHWYGPVLETYFIISGHLQLTWDEGVLDLNPHDSVFWECQAILAPPCASNLAPPLVDRLTSNLMV